MSTKLGRKQKYGTDEEYLEAKKIYNKRYYEKKTTELKTMRNLAKIKEYTDDDIKKIIDIVGFERILKLMIE
jgi:hypothetical protein